MLEAFTTPLTSSVPVETLAEYTLDAVIFVNHTFWEAMKPPVIVPITSSVPVEMLVDEIFAVLMLCGAKVFV
jgi:hypothetical protein